MGEKAFEQRLEKAQKKENGELILGSLKRELESLYDDAGTGFDKSAKTRATLAKSSPDVLARAVRYEHLEQAREEMLRAAKGILRARAKARAEEEVIFYETFPIT